MRRLVAAAVALSCFGLMACSEESGENLDSTVEQATQGQENPDDGPFERAGEAADSAAGRESNDIGDAVHDATDGDESTRP